MIGNYYTSITFIFIGTAAVLFAISIRRARRNDRKDFSRKVLSRWRSKEMEAAKQRLKRLHLVGYSPEEAYNEISRDEDLSNDVRLILWELDLCCVAIEAGIVDRSYVLAAIGVPLKQYTEIFEGYIEWVRHLKYPERYENLTRFVAAIR
jgi:hypothetical protein